MYIHDADGSLAGDPGLAAPVAQSPPTAVPAHRRHPPFRTGLGQPKTATPKKAVKAAPTAQQKRWPCAATPPRCLTTRVTAGEFGTALLRFTDDRCVHNSVPVLLTKSATFMTRARALDKHYLALDGPALCKLSTSGGVWWTDWVPNASGELTRGPHTGKRVLTFLYNATGSLFLPVGAVDNEYGYDVIVIRLPAGIGPDGKAHSGGSASSARVIAEWIAAIAHETAHAYNMVTARGPTSATTTPAQRVSAAIAEEAATRRTEAKILAEIYGTVAGRHLRAAASGMAGPTAAWQVQRDFFPGGDRRTYLEHFVLNELMVGAIKRERLKPADITRINAEIDAIELQHRPLDKNLTDKLPIYYDPGKTPAKGAGASSKTTGTTSISKTALFKTIATDYGKFRFWLRVIDARWKRLLDGRASPPARTDPARERIAQEHARAFFGGIATYDGIPKTP